MLTVETVQDFGALRALAPEWNALLQRSRSDGIFLTWEWISSWWEVYGPAYQLLVLAVRDGGGLVGIAPLMVGRGRGALARPLRRLMLIGQDVDVSPEYLDFIVEAGREAEVVRAFCGALLGEHRRRWDMLFFERVLSASPALAALQGALPEQGVELELGDEIVCFFVALPESFEVLLKGKSQHFRKRWNNTRNRLLREGEVSYRFAPEEVSVEEAYQELLRLNRERFGDGGTSFRTPQYIEVHRRFSELCAPRGWLALCLMQQQGKVIAAKYDFLYAKKIWGNQGGWSREHQQKKAGEIQIGKLLEWGIDKGAREYDFLGWPAEYKERWSTGHRGMLEEVRAYGPSLLGQAARRLTQARRLLKKHLPPEVRERLRGVRALLGRLRGSPAEPPDAGTQERPRAGVDAEGERSVGRDA